MDRGIAGRVSVLATAALFVVLLATAPALLGAMQSNSDFVVPLVMGEEAHRYPGSDIVVGNHAWFVGLWIVQWLQPLPFADHIAAGLPFALTLLAIALLARQAWRLWGSGVVVAAVALGTSVPWWLGATSWSAHFYTWWAMVLAGLTVVARGRRQVAGVVATVVWGGAVLAGDRLMLAAVVAPLVVTAVVAALARAWRPVRLAAGMAAGVVVVSVIVAAIAEATNYVAPSFPVEPVPVSALGDQVAGAFDVVTVLHAGEGDGLLGDLTGYLGGALLVIAVAALLVRLPAVRADTPRLLWLAFWGGAVFASLGAFLVASASVVEGEGVPRYLYGLPFAVGALLAAAPWRRLVLGATAALAVGVSVNLIADRPDRDPREHGPALSSILQVARDRGITRGYASYWTAYPLERASRFELDLQQVGVCPDHTNLCPMFQHRVVDAYEPRQRETFLLLDRSPVAVPDNIDWATREPAGAQPRERIAVGDGLEMLIYDHDIASHLGPAPPVTVTEE